MIILEKPNFPPYICISCGMGSGRKWFVSLNLPLDNFFNPVNEGNIFYCNDCWESLATSVAKSAQKFLIGHEPWTNDDYVQPEYEDKNELVEEVEFGTGSVNTSITIHSGATAPSEPESKPNNTESEPTVTDGESEPVSEFRVFFGDDTGGDNGTVRSD